MENLNIDGDGTEVKITGSKTKIFSILYFDGTRRWVVYKTPKSGVTSENSSNNKDRATRKRRMEAWGRR